MNPRDLTSSGAFVIGANYWASHAGTMMWRDWQPEVVADDLRRLARGLSPERRGLSPEGSQSPQGADPDPDKRGQPPPAGCADLPGTAPVMLRVFPLWPDFQPIHLLRGGGGAPVEVRFGENSLPDDDCGRAGVSQEMMDRFRVFLDLAHTQGLVFDIGLLTGWMSGRLHVPPALEGCNVLTDPFAIRWEVRFVRHFVRTFRDHPAVAAWDLGNECNCMGSANRDEAYAWTAQVVNAIRAEDPAHPVISGLHGLSPDGPWSVFDQAELCDMLTTHPYPVFTPHCNQDPVHTIRTILHSTAESRLYADLGGKPCLCQEIGTLGPVIASEPVAAQFIRSCLFSLWAHDCHGLIWWCAHDQTELAHAPYDWHAVERELGLLRVDKSAKPVLEVMGAFRGLVERVGRDILDRPLGGPGSPAPRDGTLPVRTRQAVCLLTEGQDHWGVAYSAFILAKQAGFDLEFQHCTQPLREADLYLLPCLSGHAMISRRRMKELLVRVEQGATLYMSLDSGLPSDFEAITGLEPQSRERRTDFGPIVLRGLGGEPVIPSGGEFKVRLKATRADVLAIEEDGNPAFTVAEYGLGRVFFLAVPLEAMVTRTPGALHHADAPPYWRAYRYFAQEVIEHRIVRKHDPMLGVTEHPTADGRVIVVLVNYSPEPIQDSLNLAAGWSLSQVLHGDATPQPSWVEVVVPGNDGAVLLLAKA